MNKIQYHIAVDGGGTGTRVRLFNKELKLLCEIDGDSSALGQGVSRAWKNILDIIKKSFAKLNINTVALKECNAAIGISGFNNQKWKKEFLELNPGFGHLIVETDGMTTLLGAHANAAGLIIALGTGSIGVSKDDMGNIKTVSGWGYPSGDEASGSWLGIKALRHTQKVMDGRKEPSDLSDKVMEVCGETPEKLLDWLGKATQKEFAFLAPYVFETAKSDSYSDHLIERAIQEIEEMINALDLGKTLPVCMCASVGEHITPFLPSHIKARLVGAKGTSLDGAVELLKQEIIK